MPSKRIFRIILILAAAIGLILLIRFFGSPGKEPSMPAGEERELMGTLWSIQVYPSSGEGETELSTGIDQAFSEVGRIERLMSEWRSDSPLSAINEAAGKHPVKVPPELYSIIERGIEYGDLTHGAFDITWRALGNLWHFDENFTPPDPEAVARALRHVDYRRIQLKDGRVWIPEGFAIGLGGIAKGYAIDRASEVLSSAGFHDFLVNGGGDIYAAGHKGGQPWRVGIQDPRAPRQSLLARLPVTDQSLVTSGDYERYAIVNGIRYHHIIDPRTGFPASRCRSVSILASQAEQADVLATAVFVMGARTGLALVRRLTRVEGFVIDSEGQYWMTPGFKSRIEFLK